jgi:hypothetical protein
MGSTTCYRDVLFVALMFGMKTDKCNNKKATFNLLLPVDSTVWMVLL